VETLVGEIGFGLGAETLSLRIALALAVRVGRRRRAFSCVALSSSELAFASVFLEGGALELVPRLIGGFFAAREPPLLLRRLEMRLGSLGLTFGAVILSFPACFAVFLEGDISSVTLDDVALTERYVDELARMRRLRLADGGAVSAAGLTSGLCLVRGPRQARGLRGGRGDAVFDEVRKFFFLPAETGRLVDGLRFVGGLPVILFGGPEVSQKTCSCTNKGPWTYKCT
jgi:hypothetical protein